MSPLPPEAELSYLAAMQQGANTMTKTVSAAALALHLDCTRTYIGKLEAEGVIQRQGDGYPLDQSRVAYLRYLRRERRQSPRSEADADHVRAKTEMLQLHLMQKQRDWCAGTMSMPLLTNSLDAIYRPSSS
jgi:hypothetical protein